MAGHVQSVYQAEERMSVGVEPVGKQLFHRIRAVFERRQRNVVQHDQETVSPVSLGLKLGDGVWRML